MARLSFVISAASAALLALATEARAAPSDGLPPTDAAAQALMRGDAQQAVAGYTAALQDPALSNDRRASILNDRGLAYARLGHVKLAIEDFNSAAQLFPEYAAIYNNRGSLLLSLGVLKEAVKDFDRALLLAPGYVAAYNNRAAALVRQGQVEDAIRDYTKAIQLAPTSPAPLSGRGRAHLTLARPYAAMRDFTRAVNVDARFAAGYRNRAEAKLAVDHYDEAIEDLSRAVAFDIANAETYLLRGQAYLATRNTASAVKDFTQAIALDANLAAAYAARGFAYGLAEAYEEAFADLNKAIEIDPRSSVAFAYRAFVYKQTGQLDVGLRDIETAIKVDAERAEVYWAKAEIEEAQGQLEPAIADLKKALQLRPGYRDAMDSLQRLGALPTGVEEEALPGAGIDADSWRVVSRKSRYVALNEKYPRISVPLEMMGEGQPRLIEWELKKAPFKGIGTLRFYGGAVPSAEGPQEMEFVAVLDLEESKVVAIEPHRLGKKVAAWTWEEGKVTVASVDGVTDEFPVRVGKEAVASTSRRLTDSEQGFAPWAPWAEPWAGGPSAKTRPRTARKKKKSIFDLLFN